MHDLCMANYTLVNKSTSANVCIRLQRCASKKISSQIKHGAAHRGSFINKILKMYKVEAMRKPEVLLKLSLFVTSNFRILLLTIVQLFVKNEM